MFALSPEPQEVELLVAGQLVTLWWCRHVAPTSTGVLPFVLGKALGVPPAEVAVARSRLGKPQLTAAARRHLGAQDFGFNLTHTAGVVVGAYAWGTKVGIDAERHDRPIEPRLAARLLSPGEHRALAVYAAHERPRVLVRAWTAKEALRKAQGWGVTRALAGVELDLRPGATSGFVAIDGSARRARRWALVRPALPLPGLEIALVVRCGA